MSTNQWHQYENVMFMLTERRGLKISNVLDKAAFDKQIQTKETISHAAGDIAIYFLRRGNPYTNTLGKFRDLMNQSFAKYKQVMIYMPGPPSKTIEKFIDEYNSTHGENILVYDLKHFNIRDNKGAYCGVHKKLAPEEIAEEITKRGMSVRDLPRIHVNDGALLHLCVKPGDVIRVEAATRIGERITYRQVTKKLEKGESLEPKAEDSEGDEENYETESEGEDIIEEEE